MVAGLAMVTSSSHVSFEVGHIHQALEIREFSISSKRSVAYDYFIFRSGASFKIFSCNITPFSCY